MSPQISPIEIFHNAAREGAYPGAQLACSRAGQQLAAEATGSLDSNGDRVELDTIYDLASLTKALATSVLVGRASELGLCAFDDPIQKFIPEADKDIELTHLLDHSAGFPAHLRFDKKLTDPSISGTWEAWRAIVLEAAKETPRERPIGHSAVYSDVGYILLGAALEAMFGQSLAVTFAELNSPLFFLETRGDPSPPAPIPVHPIAPTENGLVGLVHDENCRAMGGVAGHAGLWGSALGVLTFCENLVRAWHGDTSGYLKPNTVRRLWTPSSVPNSDWALGWDRPSPGASSTGGRWPRHAVGHLGFTGTSVWIEPERSLVVVLVSNRVCPSRDNQLIRKVRPALYDAAWTWWA